MNFFFLLKFILFGDIFAVFLLLNTILLILLFFKDFIDTFRLAIIPLLLFVLLLLLLFTIILKVGPIEFLCPLNIFICLSVCLLDISNLSCLSCFSIIDNLSIPDNFFLLEYSKIMNVNHNYFDLYFLYNLYSIFH